MVPLFIGFMTPVGTLWSLLTFKDEEAEVVPLFIKYHPLIYSGVKSVKIG